MNHGGGEAVAVQALGDALGAALGAREDQAAPGFLGKQTLQHLLLAVDGNFKGLHAHIFGRLERRTEREARRILQVVLYEVGDGCFHRRREAHGLALFGQNRGDALDGWEKAHVQHAVRFVENQDAQRVEVEELAIEIVFQAARSSYNETRSLANGLKLRALGEAANDERRRH